MIIYEGPSEIDGEPIVAIATGLQRKSENRKTGDMVQAWIMRADIAPVAAARAGADGSVCGDCKHRGSSCYVNLGQAPQNIWHAYQRGSYSHVPDWAMFSGRALRMSAYGDPAALPFDLVAGILDQAGTWTGYTHQWRREPRLAAYRRALAEIMAWNKYGRHTASRALFGSSRRINTDYNPAPIPDRRHDWSAIDDAAYDGGEPVGEGETEVEAILDLLDKLEACRS